MSSINSAQGQGTGVALVPADRIESLLWRLTLLFLPITSFAGFPLPSTHAKPLAIIPAALLVLLTFARRRSVSFPLHLRLCLIVLLVGLVSGCLSVWTSGLGPLKGQEPFGAYLRALMSAFAGGIFALAGAQRLRTRPEVLDALPWLLLGIAASSGFALIQFIGHNWIPAILPAIKAITAATTTTAVEWSQRHNGFSLEPSWLGMQLILVAVPCAWTIKCASESEVPKWSRALSTAMLLIFPMVALVTGSRTAIIGCFLALGAAIAFGGRLARIMATIGIALLLTIFIFFGGRNDKGTYIDYTKSSILRVVQARSIDDLAMGSNAAPRLALAFAGYETFLQHPIIGVGWGLSPWWFHKNAPEWARRDGSASVPELASMMDPTHPIWPNPKNLAIRILAESGLVGACTAILVLVVILKKWWAIVLREPRLRPLLVFGLFGAVISVITLDTFALPEPWIVLAIAAAFPCDNKETSSREDIDHNHQS